MENMFSISFRKYRDKEKEKQLVYFDHQNVILFVHTIITSTARASSVFLSSYRKTVLNQSVCVFALGYFLNKHTNDNFFYDFPKISKHFPKILQKLSKGQTNVSEHFLKLSEDYRRYPRKIYS